MGPDLRVPVAVKEDHNVGFLQIQTETAGSRGEEEQELVAVFLHEAVDHLLACVSSDATVDPAVLVATVPAVVFENVQHTRHLAENQHSGTFFLALVQQSAHRHNEPRRGSKYRSVK